jgi:hypothetical protein
LIPLVSEARLDTSRKFLAFAAVAEVGIGLAMVIDPAVVVRWLLGMEVSASGILLGRFFGIALLALELACWPSSQRAQSGSSAFRGMLTYNVPFALYLAYLGTVGNLGAGCRGRPLRFSPSWRCCWSGRGATRGGPRRSTRDRSMARAPRPGAVVAGALESTGLGRASRR